MRLLLINPNTNADTTALMVARARVGAPPGVSIEGATVLEGAPLLVDPTLLAGGAQAVERLVAGMDVSGFDGLVVAAFGDPGLDAVRRLVDVPVTGIAEAAVAEAVAVGRFAIVTTTPLLVDSIAARVAAYGAQASYLGCVLTKRSGTLLATDPAALEAELEAACREAIATLDPAAIIIGGGPLAAAAEALGRRLPVRVIEPVPAAVRLAAMRVRDAAR